MVSIWQGSNSMVGIQTHYFFRTIFIVFLSIFVIRKYDFLRVDVHNIVMIWWTNSMMPLLCKVLLYYGHCWMCTFNYSIPFICYIPRAENKCESLCGPLVQWRKIKSTSNTYTYIQPFMSFIFCMQSNKSTSSISVICDV